LFKIQNLSHFVSPLLPDHIYRFMKEVSDVLREYQYQNKLTQHDMAKFLGIAQSTYNNWVNGQVIINPVKYYKKIAILCGFEIDILLPKSLKLELYQHQDLESLIKNLEDCTKYSKNLEELNTLLRKENERILEDLKEKEAVILNFKKKDV
jgi:transcriptional regulator with XRE-family HTH domain